MTPDERRYFSDSVHFEWKQARDGFFSRVDDERIHRGLTIEDTYDMLKWGYGEDLAEEWTEWATDQSGVPLVDVTPERREQQASA